MTISSLVHLETIMSDRCDALGSILKHGGCDAAQIKIEMSVLNGWLVPDVHSSAFVCTERPSSLRFHFATEV